MNFDREIISKINYLRRQNIYSSSRGATMMEYLILVVGLGFVVYFVSLQIKPKTEDFYNKVTPGLAVEYPKGFTDREPLN